MNIQLSDHFGYRRLLRFTLPSIVMMIFTNIYSAVDGFFVSNFVGITPFAAINLIWPFTQILGSIGFMFGAGGSALVSATLGMGERERANRTFSMLTYGTALTGSALAVIGLAFIEPIAVLMGADAELLPHCVIYGKILLVALPVFMLQNLFQSFLVTAEKPTLGLWITVGAGMTNIALDALFIIAFDWGLVGAAVATIISQCVGGLVPLAYFIGRKAHTLRLGKAGFDLKALSNASVNGSSELVTNVSISVVAILYNCQLMKYAGEGGVAAYGAVMYVGYVFVSVFLGYSIGVTPVVGFHFGAQNHAELKSLFRKSNVLISAASLVLAATAFALATPLSSLFMGNDAALTEMAITAFRYYAIAVLFCGFNIFGSAFFTALNNGAVSAAISFMRTLVFQVAAVMTLPLIFGLDGIWYSMFTAEALSVLVTAAFYAANRRRYRY